MSYQVLARKWRPQNFHEMVGQQHVLQALSNALDEERLHHAYLFTGTRGVGKTTIARILVKCLNCEAGITSKPCGECSSCKEIAEGRFVDLIEVDAASRTKVEDTRELLENVHYAPTRGRFKVYLIDEVHMLSGHSFNALLKTLEEPPDHVKFLFATTDPQKLPVTILSRCLQFNLKRMPIDLITGHLQSILEQEKITFDDPSLRLLARGADGSMRDALSLMDQAIGYGGGKLQEQDVRDMLGTISHDWLFKLIGAAYDGDGKLLLETVENMSGQVPDFEAAADGLISLLHQVAVQQAVPEIEQDDDYVHQLAGKMLMEDVQLYYQIALQGRKDLPLAPDPRAGFEMLLLRMMTFRPLVDGETAASPEGGEAKKKLNKPTAASHEEAGISQAKSALAEVESRTTTLNTPESSTMGRLVPVGDLQTNPRPEPDLPPAPPACEYLDEVTPYQPSRSSFESENPAVFAENSPTAEIKTKPDKAVSTQGRPIEDTQAAPSSGTEKHIPQTSSLSPEASEEVDWHDLSARLELKGRAAQLANHCLLQGYEKNTMTLLLDQHGEQLRSDSAEKDLLQRLREVLDNADLNLTIKVAEVKEETPEMRLSRLANERQQAAEEEIRNDPFVQQLQRDLDAQIIPGSIKIKEG